MKIPGARTAWSVLAAGFMFATAGAAVGEAAYWTDNSGNLVRDNSGDCVTTNFWSEGDAIQECHPQLVVQAEPEPAPVQEQAQRPAEPRRVTRLINLEADTTFGFDSAELTEEGRARLDEIAQTAQRAQDPRVRIVGYTDHIGPETYNQELSERRAQAVREYLAQQGMPEDSIQVAARGEANPVVDCEGLSGNALIDCLRPNRRSEIEFSAFEVVDEPVEGDGTGQQPPPDLQEERIQ